MLCRSCKHQLYRPIALKSQFCVCTHDARFICLRAYHGHIPVLSEDQTKAKAKNKEIANNNQTRHAVQCTTLTIYLLGKCGKERAKEREGERAQCYANLLSLIYPFYVNRFVMHMRWVRRCRAQPYKFLSFSYGLISVINDVNT